MKRIPILVLFVSFSLLLLTTTSTDEDEIKHALINFLSKLSNNGFSDPKWGWNTTSDPCKDHWQGIICYNQTHFVKRIILDSYNFSGTFDASALCNVKSLAASLSVVSLSNNSIRRGYLDDIVNCRQLTQFNISRNQFSGSLSDSLSTLNNLQGLDISHNNFSGSLPDLPRITGLTEFLAQNNQLSGAIPNFDFPNLLAFNVSFNNLSGAIPFGGAHFPTSSYIDNPQLCGPPLPKNCPSLPTEAKKPYDGGTGDVSSENQILVYLGYFIIGLVVLIVIIFVVCEKRWTKEEKIEAVNKVASVDDSINKPSFVSSDYKAATKKSKISAVSAESIPVSSSLVVLTSPEVNGLRFEELLKAPAELLGRGKHGSVYKIICEDQGTTLAVKRIKGCTISSSDFKQRMQTLNRVKHPNVLPAVAFYCSQQEKLLVYEYQHNGSLFRLLHGTQSRQAFEWSSRLGIAATIAETLAFMHGELHEDGIPHGNLKSSNIFLNKNMEPCISEYGLMLVDLNQDLSLVSPSTLNSYQSTEASGATFKSDIYGFGVILLELLTGKISMVKNNGMDLATWVVSVVREEWTVEVFDKTLIQEGASEERMVNLLQVAIKCVNRSPEARPSINQVALMINTIKEDEDRSKDVSLLI